MQRPVLLIGGAPKIKIDAVRYISAEASGRSAQFIADYLSQRSDSAITVLTNNSPEVSYQTRNELELILQDYISRHSQALIFMSAAINDYELKQVHACIDGNEHLFKPGEKVPSNAASVSIDLKPATKLIDQLRDWGHQGPLIACKYESAESVVSSAQALQQRVQAHAVLANSLCSEIQAIVTDDGHVDHYEQRKAVLTALADKILNLLS